MLHSPKHKTRVQEGGGEAAEHGRDGGPGSWIGGGPGDCGRMRGQGGSGIAGGQGRVNTQQGIAEIHQGGADGEKNHHLRGAGVDAPASGGSVAETATLRETGAGSEGSWN